MKVLAPVFLYIAISLAAVIDGAQLTPSSGPNVNLTSGSLITLNSYDYVVVGSGAGGAPVAVRLAQAGFSVLLLEAGNDQSELNQYLIPGLHPVSTEVESMRWDYFVKSYADDAENRKSEKATYTLPGGSRYTGASPPADATLLGLLYPRAGTLGGCTSHNALIAITPQDSDWNYLQNVTGDASWAAKSMRQYLEKLEKNTYLPANTTGHGFGGWLEITQADTSVATEDAKTIQMITAAANVLGNNITTASISTPAALASFLPRDPNSADATRDSLQSLYRVPISMKRPSYQRASPVDLLKATLAATNADGTPKYKLDVMVNTLATKIKFETVSTGATPKAIGVDFMVGEALYGADPRRQTGKVTGTGKTGTVTIKKEVIISAGVFGTPQLLKLSGIGPAAELKSFNISVVSDLSGVGKNLQDRYEAPVVALAEEPFATISNCTFLYTATDPCYTRWSTSAQGDKGLYSSNGAPIAYTLKSSQSEDGNADIFLLGLSGVALTGYYPGWAANATFGSGLRSYSWVTLKAHSRNNAGTVTLKTANPQDMPEIIMRNFAVGGDADIAAAIEGTKFGRSVIQRAISNGGAYTEVWPGSSVQTDAQWKTWLRGTTWGHHACCTAKIGAASDPSAVLDSNFKVRGVSGLRVVDASAFPKIPGYYIVLPLYIAAEKAAAAILSGA